MKPPVFVHIIDPENLGDSACCPKQWLPEYAGCPEFDFRNPEVRKFPLDVPFIIGGGGMLHPEVDLWTAVECGRRPCCVWGIGTNYHESTDYAPDTIMRGLEQAWLLGLRDYSAQWLMRGAQWVPCPTCKTVEPFYAGDKPRVHPLVVISHYSLEIPVPDGVEVIRFDNHRKSWPNGHAHMLETLARTRVVVTNTFHGSYWASLLGARVINYAGRSTRLFRPLPTVVRVTDWTGVERVRSYYGCEPPVEFAREVWLDRCLQRNADFAEQVRQWLAN